MTIDLIIFDLAGTTVEDNKDVHRVLQSALRKYGVVISIEEANAVMGIPKPVAIEQLLLEKEHSSITPDLIMQIHAVFVHEMIDFYEHHPGVREKKGVTDAFKSLRDKGIKIGVDTGFDRPITDPLLQRMGWEKGGLLDVSVTSDEVAKGRPFPDLIFRAMELTGVSMVERVAKVGDTASDLQEGTSAG